MRTLLGRLAGHDGLNFLLTNRIPRRSLTRFMGRLAKIEQPLVRDLSIAVWRQFSDLDLSEGAPVKKLTLAGGMIHSGNAAEDFVEAEPFTFLSVAVD